jgi:hypothetical protein
MVSAPAGLKPFLVAICKLLRSIFFVYIFILQGKDEIIFLKSPNLFLEYFCSQVSGCYKEQ